MEYSHKNKYAQYGILILILFISATRKTQIQHIVDWRTLINIETKLKDAYEHMSKKCKGRKAFILPWESKM